MPPTETSRWPAAVAAVACLAVPLLLPASPGAPAPGWPLELPVLVLLLAAAPPRLQLPARVAVSAGLAGLVVLKALDLATATALNRPFNPVLDLPLVAAGWRLAAGSIGWPLALAAALAVLLAALLAVRALWWATGRMPQLPRRTLALTVPLLAVAALAPPASARLVGDHLKDAWIAVGDRARFRAEAESDSFAARPPDRILPALRGRDVFLVFVESYGRSSLENPIYTRAVTAALGEAAPRLAAAGLAARSGWLTSPVVGGQSWLPRASVVSGLGIDNDARYRALLASPRRTLLHLARSAGWTTVAVVPAITLPWPEAGYFGYDSVLAAADLGYRGKPFNWVTMPDQFTLAAFERLVLAPGPRPPVFAEIALISSHAPWTPVPPLLPWDSVGDGRVFDAAAGAGDPPEVVWRDPDRVRAQYRQALVYALRVVAGFAERRAGTAPLIVVIGDHQPAAFVSGDAAGRDVPVHLIGHPALLAPLDAWGWTPGLVPAADAPVWPMQALRDRFLLAFDAPPPVKPQDR